MTALEAIAPKRIRKNIGAGGYWRGEKWIAFTWGAKIGSALRVKDRIECNCRKCGKPFFVPFNVATAAKWCSQRCRYASNYTDKPPLEKKTIGLASNLLMGKDKLAIIRSMIDAALGTPCAYCKTELQLENITIDHKEPYRSSENRRNRAGDRPLRLHMDRRENLQVICVKCNQWKHDMSDDQYRRLLSFLDQNQDMRELVMARLRRSLTWGRCR